MKRQMKKSLLVLLMALMLGAVVTNVAYAEEPIGEETDQGETTGEGTEGEGTDGEGTTEQPEENIKVGKMSKIYTTALSDTRVELRWNAVEGATAYVIYRKGSSYTEIGQTAELKFVDENNAYGKKYTYKVVPYNETGEQGEAREVSFDHRQIVKITKQKYSYTDMKADLSVLEKTYDRYCRVDVIGATAQGRNLYDVVVGNQNADKTLLIVSTIHGREYACTVILMRQIEYYLRNYNKTINGLKPATVLKDMQIHYVVMANPDGVNISQTKYARWKANSRGVDLNRNYPYKFVVSGKKGPEGYTGAKAGSEKETQALMSLTKSLKKNTDLCAVINYHAMGEIIFGEYSGNSASTKKEVRTLYLLARRLTGYKDAGGYNSTGHGCYREYVMYGQGIPSITIEVGKHWCPIPYSDYQSIYNKNKMVVLKSANLY